MQMTRRHLALAALSLALPLAGATPSQAEEQNTPPPGFKALFNGKDLTNWQGLIDIKRRATLTPEQLGAEQAAADELMRAHWTVKDGILWYDGKGNSLQTARDYGNFEMYLDWRLHPKGDSGIYLRGNPQVQIWAADARSAQKDGKFIGSGGLYNNQMNPNQPLVVADKPTGEWNTFHIKMIGDRVTIKLNGQLVVDNTPLENYWERGKPLPAVGPVELQHHGDEMEFRNIYIRELPASKLPTVPARPKLAQVVSLELSQAPFSQACRLLAANGDVEIALHDPDGRLSQRTIPFVSIKNRPVDKALEIVCRAANASWARDKDGVYFVSAEPRR